MTFNWQTPGWIRRANRRDPAAWTAALHWQFERTHTTFRQLTPEQRHAAELRACLLDARRNWAIEGEGFVPSPHQRHDGPPSDPVLALHYHARRGELTVNSALKRTAALLGERLREAEHDPMQVITRRGERLTVHFEAPSAEQLSAELPELTPISGASMFSAAWRHVAFETLHPLTDGNGRSGRALLISDLTRTLQALTPGQRCPWAGASVINAMHQNLSAYYRLLTEAQRGDPQPFQLWVSGCLLGALHDAERQAHYRHFAQQTLLLDLPPAEQELLRWVERYGQPLSIRRARRLGHPDQKALAAVSWQYHRWNEQRRS